MNSLCSKRILVTGATGFIGSRLVERLVLEEKANIVALVHHFQNASRLARFPLQMIHGDMTDSDVVLRAATGCDAIVHCAVTFSGTPEFNRQVTVEGARNVCEAAKVAAVGRVVHFSTFSVYGETVAGLLTESSIKKPGKDPYARSKLKAEQIIQQYQRGRLPVTILQPTIVYGPWSFWSTYVAKQLLMGDVVLPEKGAGICNAVYVDDVVETVLLSLKRQTAAPGPFLISAAKPVLWCDFYLAHASSLASARVVEMTNEELLTLTRNGGSSCLFKNLLPANVRLHLKGLLAEIPGAQRTYRNIKSIVRKSKSLQTKQWQDKAIGFTSQRQRVLPSVKHLILLRSQTSVAIQRARIELGYAPKFNLEQGGAITAKWLKWAGFIEQPKLRK